MMLQYSEYLEEDTASISSIQKYVLYNIIPNILGKGFFKVFRLHSVGTCICIVHTFTDVTGLYTKGCAQFDYFYPRLVIPIMLGTNLHCFKAFKTG